MKNVRHVPKTVVMNIWFVFELVQLELIAARKVDAAACLVQRDLSMLQLERVHVFQLMLVHNNMNVAQMKVGLNVVIIAWKKHVVMPPTELLLVAVKTIVPDLNVIQHVLACLASSEMSSINALPSKIALVGFNV